MKTLTSYFRCSPYYSRSQQPERHPLRERHHRLRRAISDFSTGGRSIDRRRRSNIQHWTLYSKPASVKFWDEHEAMQFCTVSAWLSGSSVCKMRPKALSLDISCFEQVPYTAHIKGGPTPNRRCTPILWGDRKGQVKLATRSCRRRHSQSAEGWCRCSCTR